ncbi:MAG: aminoacyl-tRNA hydrolase [Candidatus Shapirobacteria bacterium]
MILIVGLGNPGERYQHTRHNLGFGVVDELIKNYPSVGKQFIFLKPQTFVNASGFAVAKAANFYKIAPKDIWVIHDEVDLPPGKIKIRLGGGSAGHRGVSSIIEKLGTERFVRFRLGIGHPKELDDKHLSVEKYVLQSDARLTKKLIKKATQAVIFALEKGLEKAMNRFNS